MISEVETISTTCKNGPMSNILNRTVFVYFSVLIAVISFSTNASAQKYHGDLRNGATDTVHDDKAAKPVIKVFSSKVLSTVQAEKLDVIYNNLAVSLWNYAVTDFRYQKKLFSLMESKRFKTTRYSKEFSHDMDGALKNLNNNHREMMDEIKKRKSNIHSSEKLFVVLTMKSLTRFGVMKWINSRNAQTLISKCSTRF